MWFGGRLTRGGGGWQGGRSSSVPVTRFLARPAPRVIRRAKVVPCLSKQTSVFTGLFREPFGVWKSKVSERKGNEGDGNSQCENEGDYIFPSPSTCLMNGIGAHQVKLSLCTVLQYAGISGMKYHVILRSWYQADTGTMSNTPEPTLFFFFFVVQYLPPSLFFRKVSSPRSSCRRGRKSRRKSLKSLVLETETGSLPIDRYLLSRSRVRSIEPSAVSPTTHTT